jgi:hypothetical protein
MPIEIKVLTPEEADALGIPRVITVISSGFVRKSEKPPPPAVSPKRWSAMVRGPEHCSLYLQHSPHSIPTPRARICVFVRTIADQGLNPAQILGKRRGASRTTRWTIADQIGPIADQRLI